MNYKPWSGLPNPTCGECGQSVIRLSYSPSRSEWVHEWAYLKFKQEPHKVEEVVKA